MGPAAYLPHGLPHVLQVLGELQDCRRQRVRLFHQQNPVLGQDFLKKWLQKNQLTDGTGNIQTSGCTSQRHPPICLLRVVEPKSTEY